ncbi:uncharacterized protein LOC128864099 [Anastrepha ludens]|uniref:uncharacterized protein LOC128864099 n=1 Tax=Anastrepha ludens TaxID=28586 RepID=UPI0023AF2748|nr:uncharacterized protein LOC128864099 [Anastrepha ludens]
MFKAGGTNSSTRPSENYDLDIKQETDAGQTNSTTTTMVEWTPTHLPASYLTQVVAIVKIYLLLISCLPSISAVTPFTITGRYCKQNVSVKYQEPVRHTSQPIRRAADTNEVASSTNTASDAVTENFITYESRVRWETTNVCCSGYRTLLFGFCEPICDLTCPSFSYCATPNQCECLPGYEEHHPNKKDELLLDCRPVCVDGCPPHSHCVARNRCECREGFRNANNWWFMPLKCERIRCSAVDQRYDIEQRACVKIEMSMEDLMRKVAARLAKGLNDFAVEDDEEEGEEEKVEEDANETKAEQNKAVPETTLQTQTKRDVDENTFV